MEWLILIGRIFWTMVFFGAGMGHLTQTDAMMDYAASKKVPFAKLTVQVTGVVLVLSSLMVVLGVLADLGFLIQAVWVLVVAFWMHGFWRIDDPQARMMEMTQFNKNISLAGSGFALFVFFALGGGEAFSLTITDSLFNLSL